jgi:hypothetical protein
MAKRIGKLFKKGVGYIVELAVTKVEAVKDVWARETGNGFRTDWTAWMTMVEPELRSVVATLPPRSTDIRANVVNRVIPVAMTISRISATYRASKVSGIRAPAPAPPVPAPVPAIPRAM